MGGVFSEDYGIYWN